MKCKCGGELKRIAVDCYQCPVCLVKQKIGFQVSGTDNLDYFIKGINQTCNSSIDKAIKLACNRLIRS